MKIISVLTKVLVLSVLFIGLSAKAEKTEVTYYIPDLLGSPVAAMDEAGNIKWRKHYQPYGAEIEQDDASAGNRIGYTGHAHDRDTGLTYMGARYYDPAIGRFLSMDPAAVRAEDPRTFNRYAYGNNSPYNYLDPDGRESASLEFYDVFGGGMVVNSKDNGDGTGKAELLFRFGFGAGGGYSYDRNGTISSHAERGDSWIARTVVAIEGGLVIMGVGAAGGAALPSGNAMNEEDNNNPYGRASIERPFTADTSGKTGAKLSAKYVIEFGYSWDAVIAPPVVDPRNPSFMDENIAP